MKANRFIKNFRRVKNAWIPRQVKTCGGKGPNATEERFLREVLRTEFRQEEITYQPPPIVITRTAKRVYTADFMVTMETRRIYFEVKGTYHLPTHERARLAWEIAAEQNVNDVFVWAELTRSGWEVETWMQGGREIKVQLPNETEPHDAEADWRRHKPRKATRG